MRIQTRDDNRYPEPGKRHPLSRKTPLPVSVLLSGVRRDSSTIRISIEARLHLSPCVARDCAPILVEYEEEVVPTLDHVVSMLRTFFVVSVDSGIRKAGARSRTAMVTGSSASWCRGGASNA